MVSFSKPLNSIANLPLFGLGYTWILLELDSFILAGGGAGTMTGQVYYHINDAGNESA